jgi:hypothetical protein
MLTAASSWREYTGCFCLASPFNLAFTWATEIYLHLNSCPVKCTRSVASSESRRFEHIGLPVPTHCSPFPSHRRAVPAETGTLILENSAAASQDRVLDELSPSRTDGPCSRKRPIAPTVISGCAFRQQAMEMTEYGKLRKPRSRLSTLPTLFGNPFGIATFPRPRLLAYFKAQKQERQAFRPQGGCNGGPWSKV